MKKFYFLMLLTTGILQAQIVSIPDLAFHNRLLEASPQNGFALDADGNPMAIDANGDSIIQVSEALVVFALDLEYSGIEDLTGLQEFSNLRELKAGGNLFPTVDLSGLSSLEVLYLLPASLTAIDLSSLPNLRELSLGSSGIGSLDVSANTSLENLNIGACGLSTLDVSMLPDLKVLSINQNNLVSIDLSGNPMLEEFSCRNNPITALDLQVVPLLKKLTCSFTGLTAVDVSQNPLLTHLSINNNSIAAIDLSSTPNLEVLYCGYSSIASLDVSNLPGLVMLNADYAQLASLDVSQNPLLAHLSVAGNQLTELDLSANSAITYLSCAFNLLTELDVSNMPQLNYLNCSDNFLTQLDVTSNPVLCTLNANIMNTLEVLLLKNGSGGCYQGYQFYECFNLAFVCTDDDEVAYFQNLVSSSGLNAAVSSYCTFTPGGQFNTVSGTVRYDFDSNGCNGIDPTASFVRVNILGTQGSGSVYTNQNGQYTVYTTNESVELQPVADPGLFMTISPVTVNFDGSGTDATVQDFCVAPQGVVTDLEVVVAPIIPARPGFQAVYNVVIRNKGNQVMSQQYGVSLSYNNNFLTYETSGQMPSSQTPGTLVWDYLNLMPFETLTIPVSFQVNSPTDTPPVNNGDILTLTGFALPMQNDAHVVDNVFVLNQTVVGSYDPNDKACLEGSSVSVSKVGDYLHYLIRFENTGTYPAENVVVKDILNTSDFNLSSLEILDASHPVTTRINNNTAEFIFEGIDLEIGGHGNILLKVKSLGTLTDGDQVENDANIYFDYNHPVPTDPAITLFQLLKIEEVSGVAMTIWPNPSAGIINLKSESAITKMELYNVQGRLLLVKSGNSAEESIDLSSQTNGIYLLRVTTQKGVGNIRLVRG